MATDPATRDWNDLRVVDEETCTNCGTQIEDGRGDPCPDCGQYRCPYIHSPTEVCGATYDTQLGMKLHHARVHGVSYERVETCANCNETYRTDSSDERTYCSRDCQYDALRDPDAGISLTCENCGDTFTVPPCEADEARYCDTECFRRARQHRTTATCAECGDTFEQRPSDGKIFCSRSCYEADSRERETRDCAGCGDAFEVEPAEETRYCSLDCLHHDQRERVSATCPTCETDFSAVPSNLGTYCSRACQHEAMRTRPDSLQETLVEMYVDEDRPIVEIIDITPLGRSAITTRLEDAGVYEPDTPLPTRIRQAESKEDIAAAIAAHSATSETDDVGDATPTPTEVTSD